MAVTRIDCDIHPAVGGTRTTLLPYLSDHWKEQVVSRAIDGLDLTSSNAIVFAKGGVTVAIGAGQMSRVDSVRICERKAGDKLAGAAVASDAFFPFRDGVDVLAAAGASSVVQPGGSVRDEEVIAAADEHGMAMVVCGIRHFKH